MTIGALKELVNSIDSDQDYKKVTMYDPYIYIFTDLFYGWKDSLGHLILSRVSRETIDE